MFSSKLGATSNQRLIRLDLRSHSLSHIPSHLPLKIISIYFNGVRLGIRQANKHERESNYFTSSDPHHDMLGGGCQVRVVIENIMGRMENLKTLISGFLGLVILVRWALVTMFLS